jgi:tetratricopeptide (TPR) repeat protein
LSKKSKSRSDQKKPASPRGPSAVARLPIWIILIVVLVGACVFVRTLPYEFVYDDNSQIVRNAWIRSWADAGRFFTTDVWAFTGQAARSNYYRPLQMIVYAAAHSIGGLAPFAYHLFSVLLHSLCCFWVVFIGYRLTENRWVSLAAGLLFALHPIHVESVAWIAAVVDPLCAAFYFGALYFYFQSLRRPDANRQFAFSVIFFAGALLSKEMAFTFPILAAWLDWCLERRLRWSRYAIFAALFGLYAMLRVTAIGAFSINQHLTQLPLSYQIMSTFVLWAEYIVKMFVPYGMSPFHVFQPVMSPSDAGFLLSLVFLGGLGAAAWRLRRHGTVLFLFGFCFLTIVPVLNLTGVGENVFADRYLYIPSLGSCLLIAIAAESLRRLMDSRPWRWKRQQPVMIGLSLWVIGFAWVTWREIPIWRDNPTLYIETMKRSPDAALIAHNLAMYYYGRDEVQQAEEWDTQALEGWQRAYAKDRAGLALIHFGMGNIRLRQGRIEEARDYYMKAYQEAPMNDALLEAMGIFYISIRDYQKALDFMKSAVRINPSRELAYSNIAGIYAMYEKWDQAIENARKALEVNPAYGDAWMNLAYAYAGKGMKEEARQAFLTLKRVDPAKSKTAEDGLRELGSR